MRAYIPCEDTSLICLRVCHVVADRVLRVARSGHTSGKSEFSMYIGPSLTLLGHVLDCYVGADLQGITIFDLIGHGGAFR